MPRPELDILLAQGIGPYPEQTKKVDKASENYRSAVEKHGKSSYQALSSEKKLKDAVEKREFRVEKNRPGEGKISTSRYNELRSNERLKRSFATGWVIAGPWGAVPMMAVSSTSSSLGKRAVMDVVRNRETYRVDKKTGRYENTEPFTTEMNQRGNENPVYVAKSSKR